MKRLKRGGGGEAEGDKRKMYDETKRKGKRAKKTVGMVRGEGRPGPMKYLIVLGKRAMDAIAHGREWRQSNRRVRPRSAGEVTCPLDRGRTQLGGGSA